MIANEAASEGKLGKKQPDFKEKTDETKLSFQKSH